MHMKHQRKLTIKFDLVESSFLNFIISIILKTEKFHGHWNACDCDNIMYWYWSIAKFKLNSNCSFWLFKQTKACRAYAFRLLWCVYEDKIQALVLRGDKLVGHFIDLHSHSVNSQRYIYRQFQGKTNGGQESFRQCKEKSHIDHTNEASIFTRVYETSELKTYIQQT